MGKFLEFVFNRIFLGMIATAYFWLLTLAGGVVFGLAPASATPVSYTHLDVYKRQVLNYGNREYDDYFLFDVMHVGVKGWMEVEKELYKFANQAN